MFLLFFFQMLNLHFLVTGIQTTIWNVCIDKVWIFVMITRCTSVRLLNWSCLLFWQLQTFELQCMVLCIEPRSQTSWIKQSWSRSVYGWWSCLSASFLRVWRTSVFPYPRNTCGLARFRQVSPFKIDSNLFTQQKMGTRWDVTYLPSSGSHSAWLIRYNNAHYVKCP